MKKSLLLALAFLVAIFISGHAQDRQTYSISGLVLDKNTGKPVEFATVVLSSTEQWAVADAEGRFTIQNVQPGKNVITVSCLGYVSDTREIMVSKDI